MFIVDYLVNVERFDLRDAFADKVFRRGACPDFDFLWEFSAAVKAETNGGVIVNSALRAYFNRRVSAAAFSFPFGYLRIINWSEPSRIPSEIKNEAVLLW